MDLKTGCPKLTIVNVLGVQFLGPQSTQISTINMYELIEIMMIIFLYIMGIIQLKVENHWKNFNNLPDIDILQNYSRLEKSLGVLRGEYLGFQHPNDTQKPCWLRLSLVLGQEILSLL